MFENVYKVNFELEDKYWWFVARNRIVLKLTFNYTNLYKKCTVLDFGCGTGGFASLLNKHFDVIGIDTSPLAIEFCRKRGLNNLFLGSIDDFPANKFNLKGVFALDVVEHIDDDRTILRKLFSVLQKDGYLIITVPAFPWLWSNHDDLHMHKRRYTRSQLKQLLEETGFRIEYISYFNFFLFLPAVLKRLTIKDKTVEETPPVDPVPNLLNKVFRCVFESEKFLLPYIRFPFGLSIIAIAKK